jgi:hypothetical protein
MTTASARADPAHSHRPEPAEPRDHGARGVRRRGAARCALAPGASGSAGHDRRVKRNPLAAHDPAMTDVHLLLLSAASPGS